MGCMPKRGSLSLGNYLKKMNGLENHPYRETIEALRLDYWQLINQFEPKKLDTRKWAKSVRMQGLSTVYSQQSIMMGFRCSIQWNQSLKSAGN